MSALILIGVVLCVPLGIVLVWGQRKLTQARIRREINEEIYGDAARADRLNALAAMQQHWDNPFLRDTFARKD